MNLMMMHPPQANKSEHITGQNHIFSRTKLMCKKGALLETNPFRANVNLAFNLAEDIFVEVLPK